MKKILSLLLSFVLLFSTLSNQIPTAHADSSDVIVTGQNGQSYPVSNTGLSSYNLIPEDNIGTGTVQCSDIYYVTLPSDVDSITVDFNNYNMVNDISTLEIQNDQFANTYSFSFSALYNASLQGWALSGDAAKSGTSLEAVFGSILPSDLKQTNHVIAMAGVDYNNNIWNGNAEVVLIIQKVAGDTLSTDALKTAITTAEATAADSYYTVGDRYNGKTTSVNGFWSNLQAALTNAKALFTDNDPSKNLKGNATQEGIDVATSVLGTAAGNLISKTNVNPTGLYEALQTAAAKKQTDYSAASWQTLQAQRVPAQAMLEGLFDSGSPTAANVAAYQDQVDSQTTALTTALAGLDPTTEKQNVTDAQWAYKSIDALANGLFNPTSLNQASYTADSWTALLSARETALAYRNATGPPASDIGQQAAKAYVDAYATLWNACYQGLTPAGDGSGNITASLAVVDGYAAVNGVAPLNAAGNYGVLTLPANISTLGDALNQATGASTIDCAGRIEEFCGVAVYINGQFMTEPSASSLNPAISTNYNTYRLQDGDRVLVLISAKPTYLNLSGSSCAYKLYEIGSTNVRYGTLYDGTNAAAAIVEAVAGEPLGLIAKSAPAMLNDYPGSQGAVAEASVYVSPTYTTEAEARQGAASEDTGVITAADGSFSIRLYTEGWQQLTLVDKSGKFTAMTGFNPILVHVSGAADPAAVKTALQAELDQLYGAYPSDMYRPEEWAAVKAAYETGTAAITAASTTGEARAAQQAALTVIKTKQAALEKDNTDSLKLFRTALNLLPEDTALIDQGVQSTVTALLAAYDALSDYQKGQLTGAETKRYHDIAALNAKGLAPAKTYALSLQVEGDTPEATAVLEDLYAYFRTTPGVDDVLTPVTGGKPLVPLGTFNHKTPESGIVFTITNSEPLNPISLYNNVSYNSFYRTRDAENQVFQVPGKDWRITHENFAFGDTDDGNMLNCTAGEATVYVKGSAYELKGYRYQGLTENAVTWNTATPLIKTTYLGLTHNCCNLEFKEAYGDFAMPFNDVTITAVWGPVSTADTLASAKTAAKAVLESAYGAYVQAHYAAANWQALTTAYNTGVAEVEAATTEANVATQRQTAVAAMAAVRTIAQEAGNPDGGGISGKPLPNMGAVVGKVHIVVENQTFKGAASDGSLPPWHGTLIDGWYDLCAKDTMMTAVLKALQLKGCRWSTGSQGNANAWDDYGISYLASVKIPSGVVADGSDFHGDTAINEGNLAEFSGEAGSGWMGTLNDWFTNYGFQEFGYSNGALTNGDEIRVQYTQNLGADIGGTWNSASTSLKTLGITGGTLLPQFDGTKTNYALIIPGGSANIQVKPSASNKNYLVKTFLNRYDSDSAYYKRTDTLHVVPGDTVYVGCGERSWPSMNKQGTENIDYTGTKYTIKVSSSMETYAQELIAALPAPDKITVATYKGCEGDIINARSVYNGLTAEQKKTVTNLATLAAAESRLAFFTQIDGVKALLVAIPKASTITAANMTTIKAQVQGARTAYDALNSEQQLYITVSVVGNYNAAIARLTELGAYKTDEKPKEINKSEKTLVPNTGPATFLAPPVSVSGGTAAVVMKAAEMKDAIAEVKKNSGSDLVIAPKITGTAKKVTVELPKDSVSSIATDTGANLVIDAGIGRISLPNSALDAIASQPSKGSVTISLNTVDTATLSAEQKKNVGKETVYDISVLIGTTSISTFSSGSITISLPYTLKAGENPSGVAIWYLSDAGELKQMACTYDKTTGLATFSTPHLSLYAVGYSTSWTSPYKDVKPGDWFYDAAKYTAQSSLMSGTSPTLFSPEDTMTRGMLVTVLYRMEGKPAVSGAPNFTDVQSGQWYTDAINWAGTNKLITGYGNGLFGTDSSVTREQLATLLMNYATYKRYDITKAASLQSFSDAASVDAWASAPMKWAVAEKLITGTSSTALSPDGTATRAQVATILMRFAANKVK